VATVARQRADLASVVRFRAVNLPATVHRKVVSCLVIVAATMRLETG